MLWVYYQHFPNMPIAIPEVRPGVSKNDYVFPIFILTEIPHVFKGFLIVAILSAAMSSVSSALAALSSVSTMDFFKPLAKKVHSEEFYLKFSRSSTVVWAVALIGVAYCDTACGIRSQRRFFAERFDEWRDARRIIAGVVLEKRFCRAGCNWNARFAGCDDLCESLAHANRLAVVHADWFRRHHRRCLSYSPFHKTRRCQARLQNLKTFPLTNPLRRIRSA